MFSGNSGWGALLAAVLVVAAVWLVVLPWVERQPGVRSRIEFLERCGIDPSALYYTETAPTAPRPSPALAADAEEELRR